MVRTIAIATAVICALFSIVLRPNVARTASEAWGDQVLQLTDGTKIDAVFEKKTRSFKAIVAQSKGALKDGTYKVTNGGAIRVKDGVIVWDAFGVIERLKTDEGLALAPVGLA
jgi:hypothetical protein